MRPAPSARSVQSGRSSRNALCLVDATVSGRHAELLSAANSYVVRDLLDLAARLHTRHDIAWPGE